MKAVKKNKNHLQIGKEKHHLKNFKNSILKKYNLSVENYNIMLSNQNNQCAICKKTFSSDRSKSNLNFLPCVDHCHRTNEVRGLLCRMCNLTLGYIESGLFEKAKQYLESKK